MASSSIAAGLLLLCMLHIIGSCNAFVIKKGVGNNRFQNDQTLLPSSSIGNDKRSSIPAVLSPIVVSLTIAMNAVSPVIAADVNSRLYGLDRDDRLLKCKTNSNCISTSSVKSLEKYSAPWAFTTDAKQQFEELKRVVNKYELLKIVDQDDDKLYLRAEAKSAIPIGGIDDVEFKINALDMIIGYRTNSRDVVMAGPQVVGDGGSNRNRLESIRRSLGLKEMNQNNEVDAYIKEFNDMNFIQQQQMASLPNPINFIDNSVAEENMPMDKMIGEDALQKK